VYVIFVCSLLAAVSQ